LAVWINILIGCENIIEALKKGSGHYCEVPDNGTCEEVRCVTSHQFGNWIIELEVLIKINTTDFGVEIKIGDNGINIQFQGKRMTPSHKQYWLSYSAILNVI
jgi:hypothetical protein